VIFSKIDRWIEQRLTIIGTVLIALVILLYIISQFVPDISNWIITRGFFSVILIALIIDLLYKVVDMKGPPSLEVYEDQTQALTRIQEEIEKERPGKADLLEYSTSTIRVLLERLRKANVTIRLLICHPDKAASPHERKTIKVGIDNLRKDFKNYENITVRQYWTPASLRGRNIGDKWINVGWYLYSTTDGKVNIKGHGVTMILSDTSTSQGRKLKEMFSRTFDELWNDPTTKELVLTSEAQGSVGRV